MIRVIFVLSVLVALYYMYISPMLRNLKGITNDEDLKEHILVMQEGGIHDKLSYEKGINNLKSFLMYYSNTFSTNVDDLQKMKSHKLKTMKYFTRIIHRIPNDLHLPHKLENSTKQINDILDSYILESSDRKNEYYFPPM